MAIKPNAITLVVFLLVFASATSAMPTEGAEYHDSEFLDELSGYATEGWTYVSPPLETFAELLYAQATSNNTSFCSGSSTQLAAPAQSPSTDHDAFQESHEHGHLPQVSIPAEAEYPSPGVAHLPPHLYPESSAIPHAINAIQSDHSWSQIQAPQAGYAHANTQNWLENAYLPGLRVQPASELPVNWPPPMQYSPNQTVPELLPPLTPVTSSTPFTSISGEPSILQPPAFPTTPAVFTCSHPGCNFTSPTAQSLRHHQRYHLPESLRPHGCNQCDRRFHCPREVERHMITHTSERRYFCEVPSCLYATKGFGRKDHLTRHTRAKHPVESPVQTADTTS